MDQNYLIIEYKILLHLQILIVIYNNFPKLEGINLFDLKIIFINIKLINHIKA